MTCVECGQVVPIPKLGELRKLPQSGESQTDPRSTTEADSAGGSRIGFVAAAMVATACLLVAGFCTIRWAIVDVPVTTAEHIAEYTEAYQTEKPATLILEFEEMEKRGLELPVRYNYKTLEINKQTWARNALVAGAVGTLALLVAIVLSMMGRKRRPA